MASNNGQTRRTVIASASAGVLAAGMSGTAWAQAAPVAKTAGGQVRGISRNRALVFMGIPYGASTAGANRFMPPKAPAKWTGVFDGTKLGQRAPQTSGGLHKNPTIGAYMSGGRGAELDALGADAMGENCLVLNVLTPALDNQRRPVIVYLHGGGYNSGSGSTHTLGDRFAAEENIVLVTVNHRLGNMGFLYVGGLNPQYSKGNVGMLDIVQALQWVRDNIANFGGDPAKVTIQGESGGGGKVSMLMAMPQAKGLFRAAIIESAGATTPAAREGATTRAKELFAKIGVDPTNAAAIAAVPLQQLIGSGGPVADGVTVADRPWPDAAPETAANIPLLLGYCQTETTWGVGMDDQTLFKLEPAALSARLAKQLNKSEDALAPAIAAYKQAYPNAPASDIFFQMSSAATTARNMRRIVDMKTKQTPPVYFYRIDYDVKIAPGLRSFHTCELPLTWRMVANPDSEGLSKQLAGAWAAFARNLDPNHAGMPRWEPAKAGQGANMFFNLQTKAGADPEAQAQTTLLKVMSA